MWNTIKNWTHDKWLKAKRFWRHALAVVGIGALAAVASVGAPIDVTTDLSEIKTAQERYIDEHGKYAQVLPCDKPSRNPHYQEGRPLSDYGITLPCNWHIIEYETPDKTFGYNVGSTTDTGRYSKGYGKEAKSRTFRKEQIQTKTETSSSTSFRLPDFNGFARFVEWMKPLNVYAALQDNTHSTDLEADSSQYWSITDANQTGLDGNTDMTWSFWAKPESINHVTYLLTKDDEGANRSYAFVMGNFGSHTSGDGLRITVNGGGGQNVFDKGGVFSADTWVHIVATFDGSAGAIRLWVDNVEQTADSSSSGASSVGNTGSDFRVGALGGSSSDTYDGLIDDVRVWNSELSDANVSTLHDTPCDDTVASANLQGHWLFDNDGTDQTANSNDLTNNNSATFSTDTAYECEAAPTEETTNTQIW